MQRKRLYLIAGVFLGLMLFFALISLFLPKNGKLTITAPSATAIRATITNDNLSTNKNLEIAAGASKEVGLRPGTYQVSSTGGSFKTIDVVTISKDKPTKLNVSFAVASKVSRLATALDYCPMVIQDTVYDYDCNGYGFIYQQNGLEETKSILYDSQLFDRLVAYKTGFLGIPAGQALSYINLADQTVQALNLPAELSLLSAQNRITITTSSEPTKTYFALGLAEANTIYLYQDITDQNPIRLKLPEDDLLSREYFMNSLSFSGDHLILYAGPIDATSRTEIAANGGVVPDVTGKGMILEYDLLGKQVKKISTPTSFIADRVLKLNDEFYVADRTEGTEFFHLESGGLKSVYLISEIVGTVPLGDKLYMQTNEEIYLFTPGEGSNFSIKSTYTAPGYTALNSIYAGPGYLVFTATPNTSEVAEVYRLEN